jgi:hypothetical protein
MQTRRFGGFCYSGVWVFSLADNGTAARRIARAAQSLRYGAGERNVDDSD